MHVYVSLTGETTDNGTLNPLTPGTGEKVKTGDSGQTDGVTEANKVTEGSPFKTSMDRKLCLRANYLPNNWCKQADSVSLYLKTDTTKVIEPAGKPDDTLYVNTGNGGQGSHRDVLSKKERERDSYNCLSKTCLFTNLLPD